MNRKIALRQEAFNKECDWLIKKTICHRGIYDNESVFENTLEAYNGAIEKKVSIELDVQLTNDLQVICFHDTSLKRFFNRSRDVKDISYKRLNKIRYDLQVPLLKDVLKLVNGETELVIELKSTNGKYNKLLVKKVYEILKNYRGKYVIVSFNPFMIKAYKNLDKNAYVGINTTTRTKNILEKLVVDKGLFNWFVKPDFISCDIDNFNDKQLSKYKEKGYKIIGWTLKDEDRKKELVKYYHNFIVEGIE